MMLMKGFIWQIELFLYGRVLDATLGPEFKIDLERPRDKTAMNDNANFKKTRNAIIEYLMDIGNERKSEAKEAFILPDLSSERFCESV